MLYGCVEIVRNILIIYSLAQRLTLMQRLVCSEHAMTTQFSNGTDETVKEDGQAEQ